MYSKIKKRKMCNYILFVTPAFLIFTVFWIVPVLFNFFISFTKWNGLSKLKDIEFVGVQHFKTMLFADTIFRKAFMHNLEFVVLSMLIIPAFSFAVALIVEKCICKGRGFFRTTLFIPAVLPMMLTAILFRWVFSNTGIVNSLLETLGLEFWQNNWLGQTNTALPVVFLINVWKSFPFYMTILLAGLQSVPRELEEAALIDGCTNMESIRYVTIPLMKQILVVVFGLVMMDGFKVYDLIFVLTKGGPANATVVTSVYTYALAFEGFRVAYATAISTFNVIVVLAISMLYLGISNRMEKE